MVNKTMKWCVWRINLFGPPTFSICDERPGNGARWSVDDPDYPYRQVQALTDADYMLSMDELRMKYPYIRPKEDGDGN